MLAVRFTAMASPCEVLVPRMSRETALAIGAAADLVCWPIEGIAYAGGLSDPVETWLRC